MTLALPTTIAGAVEAAVASHFSGCPTCGERHNPRRISCSDVAARIDGVTRANPEGTGGLACWAGPKPIVRSVESDEEWGQ